MGGLVVCQLVARCSPLSVVPRVDGRRARLVSPAPQPEIFNTDQGAQFTSRAFTGELEAAGIAISMDGRGRALDNVFIERLWRTVKYEHIYLYGYETARELEQGLATYFDFYRYERLHMALGYQTPWEVYSAGRRVCRAAR